MADAAPKSEGRKGARKHTGLGRGLGALIPQASEQTPQNAPSAPSRPLDVFFPEGSSAGKRGGSAKELLQPKRGTAPSKKKRPSMPSVEAAGGRRSAGSRSALGGGINGSDSRQKAARVPAHDAVVNEAEKHDEQNVSRETSVDHELLPVPGASFAEIAIDQIVPNTKQPREVFDEDDLKELSASIKEVGVLQPVVVRSIPAKGRSEKLTEFLAEKPEARYELIMGERRLRASELAGETTIPAIIRETEDGDLLRDALLENLHRAQLNPLEEASAYQQLMADFGATQEELAKRIARSRPQIANTLRLLKLPSRKRLPLRSSPPATPVRCCLCRHPRKWNDWPSASSPRVSPCAPLKRSFASARRRQLRVRAHASSARCRSWGRASCRRCPTRTIRA